MSDLKPFLVACVWQDFNGSTTTSSLRHGITSAVSKEEALGKFILESDVKGSISHKSVVHAEGWRFKDD